MNLLEERDYYKPFNYPWAFEYYKRQQQMHWLPDEVPLQDDIKDYKEMRFKIFGEPFPMGLKQVRYFGCFWERSV